MQYVKTPSYKQPPASNSLRISAQIRIGDAFVEREFAGADARALTLLIESGQRGVPEHRLAFSSLLALRAKGIKLRHVREVGDSDVGRRIALADPSQVKVIETIDRAEAA